MAQRKTNATNVLLLGETGSGKSTFINYLLNYFKKGSIENLRIAIPTRYLAATETFRTSELDVHDVTKSKTSECTHYHFGKYNFIDSPGFSDTRGRKAILFCSFFLSF
jgi:predicted GTPase